MSKYIRTKDGIYGPLKNNDFILEKGTFFGNRITNQADTIEELCDEKVIIDAVENHIVVRTELEKIWWKQHDEDCVSCYGAIWTDKGLIYVAKMNEKGELELI